MSDQAYSEDTSHVTSVWSSYGHRFIGEDENYVTCLTCGAMYQELAHADDLSRGAYLTMNGDEPMECSRDTSMVHGYPGERACDCADGACSHCSHDCNCVRCR